MTEEQIKHLVARHDKIVDVARRMRAYQKEYFKYRTKQDLELSKRFERELDKLISEEVKVKKSKQGEVF